MLAGTAAASSRFVEFSIERRCASTVPITRDVAGDGRGGSRVRGPRGALSDSWAAWRDWIQGAGKLWSPRAARAFLLSVSGAMLVSGLLATGVAAGRARAHHRPARPRRRGMVRRGLEHQHESCVNCCSRPCNVLSAGLIAREICPGARRAHHRRVDACNARGRGHESRAIAVAKPWLIPAAYNDASSFRPRPRLCCVGRCSAII